MRQFPTSAWRFFSFLLFLCGVCGVHCHPGPQNRGYTHPKTVPHNYWAPHLDEHGHHLLGADIVDADDLPPSSPTNPDSHKTFFVKQSESTTQGPPSQGQPVKKMTNITCYFCNILLGPGPGPGGIPIISIDPTAPPSTLSSSSTPSSSSTQTPHPDSAESKPNGSHEGSDYDNESGQQGSGTGNNHGGDEMTDYGGGSSSSSSPTPTPLPLPPSKYPPHGSGYHTPLPTTAQREGKPQSHSAPINDDPIKEVVKVNMMNSFSATENGNVYSGHGDRGVWSSLIPADRTPSPSSASTPVSNSYQTPEEITSSSTPNPSPKLQMEDFGSDSGTSDLVSNLYTPLPTGTASTSTESTHHPVDFISSSPTTTTSTTKPDEGSNHDPDRIFLGYPAQTGWFPYAAQISIFSPDGVRRVCTGSIFNQYTIITAANCFNNNSEGFIEATGVTVYGGNAVRDQGIPRGAKQIKIHPDYKGHIMPNEGRYDIALVILNDPYSYNDNLGPIQIAPNQRLDSGTHCILAAFGSQTGFTGSPWENLQYAPILLRPDSDCVEAYKNTSIFDPHMSVCGGGNGASRQCTGDAGGALVCLYDGTWAQYGVVDMAKKASDPDKPPCGDPAPGTYAFAPFYKDWINTNARWY